MFLEQMMRLMAGPYFSSFIDWYCANQEIFNTILVGGAVLWTLYRKKTASPAKAEDK